MLNWVSNNSKLLLQAEGILILSQSIFAMALADGTSQTEVQ